MQQVRWIVMIVGLILLIGLVSLFYNKYYQRYLNPSGFSEKEYQLLLDTMSGLRWARHYCQSYYRKDGWDKEGTPPQYLSDIAYLADSFPSEQLLNDSKSHLPFVYKFKTDPGYQFIIYTEHPYYESRDGTNHYYLFATDEFMSHPEFGGGLGMEESKFEEILVVWESKGTKAAYNQYKKLVGVKDR